MMSPTTRYGARELCKTKEFELQRELDIHLIALEEASRSITELEAKNKSYAALIGEYLEDKHKLEENEMSGDVETVYVVWVNSDLTEGRGREIPKHVCEIEETARRLAQGAGVQGTGGRVEAVEVFKVKDEWRFPGRVVNIEHPTIQDLQVQTDTRLRNEVLKRAKNAGLTDDDIEILTNGIIR